MSKPMLLDLYCKAGGASRGYQLAGFHVTGVDHKPQPRYVGDVFVQADAMEFLAEHGREFDAIHASPPCQRYSVANNIHGREDHPDLIAETRRLLIMSGRDYVIENVPGAPLQFPVVVCGLALGLGVKRHRLFESNILLFGTYCPPGHRGDYISVFGHGAQEKAGGKGWVTVFGGGAPKTADRRRRASAELAKLAMGINWMTRDELSQAVPPAYTCHLGLQLIQAITENT